MMMGQVGPRTVLKCRMRGIRLVRNRVSMITAALVVTVPLNKSLSQVSLSPGFDVDCPSLAAVGRGRSVSDEIDPAFFSSCWEYMLRIVD